MSNLRVHELAKNLGMTSKDLIAILAKEGISAKSHMSSLDTEAVELITELLKKDKTTPAAPPVQAEPAVVKKTKPAGKKKEAPLRDIAALVEPPRVVEPPARVIPEIVQPKEAVTAVAATVGTAEVATPKQASGGHQKTHRNESNGFHQSASRCGSGQVHRREIRLSC